MTRTLHRLRSCHQHPYLLIHCVRTSSGSSFSSSAGLLLPLCFALGKLAEGADYSHMLWITVCNDIFSGSLDFLRIAHCSGGTYCDVGDYNSSDETQDTIFSTVRSLNTSWSNDSFTMIRQDKQDGFERAIIGPGITYGFAYSLDIDPTSLAILKEPGYDAL